eukprot:8883775-Pyramimonas_sp.AAC.1
MYESKCSTGCAPPPPTTLASMPMVSARAQKNAGGVATEETVASNRTKKEFGREGLHNLQAPIRHTLTQVLGPRNPDRHVPDDDVAV